MLLIVRLVEMPHASVGVLIVIFLIALACGIAIGIANDSLIKGGRDD